MQKVKFTLVAHIDSFSPSDSSCLLRQSKGTLVTRHGYMYSVGSTCIYIPNLINLMEPHAKFDCLRGWGGKSELEVDGSVGMLNAAACARTHLTLNQH